MRKILFIVDSVDNGGVGIVLRNLLTHLNKTKYQAQVLTFERNPIYEQRLPKEVTIRHIYHTNPAKHPSKLVRYGYALLQGITPKWLIRKCIFNEPYDLVIDFKGNNLNVLNAAPCKKIFWSHKDFSLKTNPIERVMLETYGRTWRGRAKEYFFKKQLGQVDGIVCISDYTKNAFMERWGKAKPVYVVHNIIDTDEIIRQSKEKISYQKPIDQPVFCCVSRISKGKGMSRLLNCVSRLNAQNYRFELNIVGGGDGYEALRLLKQKAHVANVTLWGNQDNPFPYLRESDVFVCPSKTECYSTVLCEAIGLGKPIIMTDTGASREIMCKGNFGLLVENSEEGIFQAMKKFLDDPSLIQTYTRPVDGKTSVFNASRAIKEVEDFLDVCF